MLSICLAFQHAFTAPMVPRQSTPIVMMASGWQDERRLVKSIPIAMMAGAKPFAPTDAPPQLAEWGCTDELWSQLRHGGRSSLRRLVRDGDEEHARRRIAHYAKLIAVVAVVAELESTLTGAIAADDAAQKPASARKPAAAQKPASGQKARGGPGSQTKGYVLQGNVPEGFDVASVEAMIAKRTSAKLSKDYATADALREELLLKGVKLSDQHRAWTFVGA